MVFLDGKVSDYEIFFFFFLRKSLKVSGIIHITIKASMDANYHAGNRLISHFHSSAG